MKIFDLLPADLYLKMAQENYIRQQSHPDFAYLRILNYTQSAQFDGVWNEVTEQCRGLIYDMSTMEVLARPFRKFFNYGQSECPEIDLNAPAVVMDKMDGSLGILYKTPVGGYAIATRGSFSSDQAIHATKILNEKYKLWLEDSRNRELLEEYTLLVEIIYPQNRIVCDYEGMDDLVLLDAVNIETGESWGSAGASVIFDWQGPVAEEFEFANMAAALEAAPRPGAEGYVVLFPETGDRVKIKQQDYIELHRIVTGLNARTVWEHAKDGKYVHELIDNLPDEFHEWVGEIWESLWTKYAYLNVLIESEFEDVVASVEQVMGEKFDKDTHRAIFAKYAKLVSYTGFLFSKLDGKEYQSKVWEIVKPDGNITPSNKILMEDEE